MTYLIRSVLICSLAYAGSAFADKYVAASVDQLVPDGETETLAIHGNADADKFKRAWLQIGQGAEPTAWKYVGLKMKRPVKNALLSKIPLSEFEGGGVWTIRLNVEHVDGTVEVANKGIRLR